MSKLTLEVYERAVGRVQQEATHMGRLKNGLFEIRGRANECISAMNNAAATGCPLDEEALAESLSDILWDVTQVAIGLGISLDDIAKQSIDRSLARNPEPSCMDNEADPLPKGKLTNKQMEIYSFIHQYSRDHGYPPSMREIQAAAQLKSVSTAHFHLKKLEDGGFIKRDGRKTRAISFKI